MARLLGSTQFTWTDGGAQTHELRVPLQQVRPAFRGKRWVREALDFTREVFTATTVYEIVARIRYEDDPQSLVDLLIFGWEGGTITYDDGDGTTVDCYLIEPSADAFSAEFDDHQQALDELTVEVRLRRTDGSAFPAVLF